MKILAEKTLLKDLNARYEFNLQLLKEIRPVLRQKLIMESSPDTAFKVEMSPGGIQKITLMENNTVLFKSHEEEKHFSGNELQQFCREPVILADIGTGELLREAARIPLPVEFARLPLDKRPINPVYVIEKSADAFALCFYLHDFRKIITDKRFYFFVGCDALEEFKAHLLQEQIPIPSILLNSHAVFHASMMNAIEQLVHESAETKKERLAKAQKEVLVYYNALSRSHWMKKFQERTRLKTIILYSDFGTFVQYSARDVADGFASLGIQVVLQCVEKGIERATPLYLAHLLLKHKPDFLFMINHLRWEFEGIPENIPFITWVQDILPHLVDAEAPQKLDSWNIVLAHPDLIGYGYNTKDLCFPAPLYSNVSIFKKRTLAVKEQKKYECDVSFVSNHSTTPEQALLELIHHLNTQDKHILNALDAAFREVKSRFTNLKPPAAIHQYNEIFQEAQKSYGIELTDKNVRRYIVSWFYYQIGSKFLKWQPLYWLKEAGINFKLFGNGWENHTDFAPYACGYVEHGEELSKVLQASKINLHIDYAHVHQRVIDCMASGGFILISYSFYCEDFLKLMKKMTKLIKKVKRKMSVHTFTGKFAEPYLALHFKDISYNYFDKTGNDIITPEELNTVLNLGLKILNEAGDTVKMMDFINISREPKIYFKSKNDFLEKIHYFLRHTEEREEIAQRMRSHVQNHLSHITFCKNILSVGAQHFEKVAADKPFALR